MRYRVHGAVVDSAILMPELRRASGAAGDVTVELATGPLGDKVEWFHSWRSRGRPGRARPWLAFGRTPRGFVLRFPDLVDFEVTSAGDCVRCRPASRLAPSTFRHLLIDQVLPLALTRSGRLVLHASAVHVPRFGAVAFAGHPGSGKSTMAGALALRECSVLADDCLVIESSGDRKDLVPPTVQPGYPGLRLWPPSTRALGLRASRGVAHYTRKRRLDPGMLSFRDRPSPLRAIFVLGERLTRNLPPRVTAHRGRAALLAAAPYAYLMDVTDPGQLAGMFRSLSGLVAEVPVLGLRVADDRRHLPQMADAVLALARQALDS